MVVLANFLRGARPSLKEIVNITQNMLEIMKEIIERQGD